MSRSGYTDDMDDPLAHGRWRQAVRRAIEGKRGQVLLRELAQALDEMPVKHLYQGSFATAEGEFCALGVLGTKRGTRMDDLGDEDGCDPEKVGERFGIAESMAAEIMYLNDEKFAYDWYWTDIEVCGPMRPYWPEHGGHKRHVRIKNLNATYTRWRAMRAWVSANLKDAA